MSGTRGVLLVGGDQLARARELSGEGRVLHALGDMHRALDEALIGISQPAVPFTVDEAEALADRINVVACRVEALQLRAAAAVKDSRSSAHQSVERVVEEASGILARGTHTDRRLANQQTRLAAQLGNNPFLGADNTKSDGAARAAVDVAGSIPGRAAAQDAGAALPRATSVALDAGRVSAAHARIIMRALNDLPEGLDAGECSRVEAHLVEMAARMAPGQLRRAARRALAAVEPDERVVDREENRILGCEEDRAWQGASFWLRDDRNGTMTGGFTVPFEAGAMLRAVLDAMTAPRRGKNRQNRRAVSDATDEANEDCLKDSVSDQPTLGSGATGAAGSTGAGAGSGVDRDLRAGHDTPWSDLTPRERELRWQQLRGRAFAELLGHMPTDHLSSQVPATIVVHTDLNTLRADTDRAGVTDTGDKLTAGTIRRLACQAGILPTILGGESLPLDLGRKSRCFSPAQRLALTKTYQTCAERDCDRPFAWTEIHHLTPWNRGGATDLNNAVPLCGRHHRDIDAPDRDHTIHRQPDGTITIEFHPKRPPPQTPAL